MTATLPLPRNRRHIEAVGCPHCGRAIGLDHRCPHLVELLTPGENGGQWAVVVSSEEQKVPVLKMGGAEHGGVQGSVTDRVRRALLLGSGTDCEIRTRGEIDSQGAAASAIQRLCARGEVEVVAVRREPRCKRLTRVYGLTAAGRERAGGESAQRMAG